MPAAPVSAAKAGPAASDEDMLADLMSWLNNSEFLLLRIALSLHTFILSQKSYDLFFVKIKQKLKNKYTKIYCEHFSLF